jgi:plastocyanin
MRRLVFTTLVGIALLAAGCGSSGGGSSASAPATTPAPAPTSGGKAGGGGVTKIDMKNIQFSPGSVTVKKGSTVEWVNDDSVNHDVTKQTGPGPNFSSGSGNLANGDTYKVTFNTAGTVKYECTVHPGMTGTIVVK